MKPGQLSDDERIAQSIMTRNGWWTDCYQWILEKVWMKAWTMEENNDADS